MFVISIITSNLLLVDGTTLILNSSYCLLKFDGAVIILLSKNYSELMRHFPAVSKLHHSVIKMVVLIKISQMNNNYNIFLSNQTLRMFLIKFISIINNILNTFVFVRVSGRIGYFDISSTFWKKCERLLNIF